MIARGFKSVGWAAAVAGTALGCYMVNLKVAAERAALEDVETRIVLAQRDIRVLQTEIGTRGRLEQLEKWNVKVLALSAPSANQFLEGSFQLATLTAPKKTVDPAAPVVLASVPAPAPKPVITDDAADRPAGASPAELMHVASLRRDEPAQVAASASPKPKLGGSPKKAGDEGATVKPSAKAPTSTQKTVDKTADAKTSKAAAATKPAKPKAESPAKPAKAAAASTSSSKPTTKTRDTKSRQ